MPTALITGATGLLGSHVLERLHGEGWTVRALVRDPGRASWLADAGAELRPGDVLDPASLNRAATGCDLVVHAAAAIFHAEGWSGYERSNVTGTANAIAAAREAGARLVHVSSVAVYGPGARYRDDGSLTAEDAAMLPIPPWAHYARSKRDSEALVLDAHRRGELWATAVRPSVIYGRRDRQFVPRMARLVERAVIPMVNGGRSTMSVVHAANVADGLVRAATSDAAGGRAWNLADDFPVTVEAFFRLAAEGLGRRLRTVRVPLGLAQAGATVVARVAPLLGFDRSVTSARSSLDFISRNNPFTSERARRELGWAPAVRHEEGVPDAFAWWRRERAR